MRLCMSTQQNYATNPKAEMRLDLSNYKRKESIIKQENTMQTLLHGQNKNKKFYYIIDSFFFYDDLIALVLKQTSIK